MDIKIKNPKYTQGGSEPKYINLKPTFNKEELLQILDNTFTPLDKNLELEKEIKENAEVTAYAFLDIKNSYEDRINILETNIQNINNKIDGGIV